MRKISRIIQTIRDAILAFLSLVLISTSIGPGKEMANYFLAAIMAVFLILSLINIGLNALKVKRKGFFYGNSVFQIVMGLLLTGLFAPLGIIVLAFNFAVVASLWEKKTPEELLKHPPKPITAKHRLIVGAGVLLMLASGLLSWLSPIYFPIIGVYFRTVDLSVTSGLVTSSPLTTVAGVLALVGLPVSMVVGSLGLLWRRFAWASGVLALAVGFSWLVILTAVTGLGPLVFLIGGIVVLSARFIAK